MLVINKSSPSFIISDVILQQEGDFTENDILNKVKYQLIDQFESLDDLLDYVVFKLCC